jgi:hypothetical protein
MVLPFLQSTNVCTIYDVGWLVVVGVCCMLISNLEYTKKYYNYNGATVVVLFVVCIYMQIYIMYQVRILS